MAELKTKKNAASVAAFVNGIADEGHRRDARTVVKLMREVTGAKPTMWGTSIVGFGSYQYKYASGQGGDWPLTAFSPRKGNLTLYIMAGFERYSDLLRKLGKFKTGRSCLYVKRLADIDLPTLEQLVRGSVKHMMKAQRTGAKRTTRKYRAKGPVLVEHHATQ